VEVGASTSIRENNRSTLATRRFASEVTRRASSLEAFEHDDPRVRQAAVLAVGYVEWPELVSRLKGLSADDPDDGVRANAEAMIASMSPQA
jgi:HEAT repeat protein